MVSNVRQKKVFFGEFMRHFFYLARIFVAWRGSTSEILIGKFVWTCGGDVKDLSKYFFQHLGTREKRNGITILGILEFLSRHTHCQ
jgi:hypothetical protein